MIADHEPLKALEWDRFIELAVKEARSIPGQLKVRAWTDSSNWAQTLESCQLRQQESAELSALLDREAFWGPISGLGDPIQLLDGLERGLYLNLDDLVCLRSWLYAMDSWSHVPKEELGNKLIRKALGSLMDPHEPLRFLDRVLTPDGKISEKASSRLAQLNSEIRVLKREIEQTLEQVVRRWDQAGVLQEKFTDVREGRYVVPVRVSDQSKVQGVVCGTSSSKQSVFIEPHEVEVLNRRLRQKESELSQEITEILLKLAAQLRPFSAEIRSSVEILAHWDSVQARARLARHYGGRTITVTGDRVFLLSHSAHPLLWWSLSESQITRNEIDFGGEGRVLLLTGPNTGGKTVLLKTLGLAAICARTGFPFPGSDRIVVPYIDNLYVDLGDPQSIERHLSSFSGHVLLLKRILENVTPRGLVLLDELNSATDPQEGAALARAVLESILAKGDASGACPLVIATTHDPTLKALAFSDSRIVNASMEFDETSHSPTYRLQVGVPGRSRALDTARRLGIPAPVLELAYQYLSSEHVRVEALLSQLESETQRAAQARREAIHIKEEAERLKADWSERTGKGAQEMLDRARIKLRQIVEQAQEEIRLSVRKLEETKTHRGLDESRKKINEAFSQAQTRSEKAFAEEAPSIAELLKAQLESQETSSRKLEKGAIVRVPKWKCMGHVIEIQGDKTRVQLVQGGKPGLTVTLALIDVELPSDAELESYQQTTKLSQRKFNPAIQFESPASASEEIDLRGVRFEEAMSQLEGFLDRAFRSGRREARIIHGLGTGALREGARKLLSRLPYVANARDGGPHEGGSGATVVEFEKS